MQVSAEDRSWPNASTPRTFAGVEIIDSRLQAHGEIMLWSVGGLAPRHGELFTIEHGQTLHDLSVVEVQRHSPGWSALCRRVDIAWG